MREWLLIKMKSMSKMMRVAVRCTAYVRRKSHSSAALWYLHFGYILIQPCTLF